MMRLKVAFFEVKEEQEKEYLLHRFEKLQVAFFAEPLSQKNVSLVKDFDIIVVFIDSVLGRDMLSRFTNLKLIATRSTGFDHIDLDACRKMRISVCNVPHYGDNAVAEYAFGLILDLSRKI